MATKTVKKVAEEKPVANKLCCTCCGAEKREKEFYMSKAYIYKNIGKTPICKVCLGNVYDKYYNRYQNEKEALYYMCRAVSICFSMSCYNATMREISNGKQSNIWQIYMTKLNSIGSKNGAGDDFDSSDNIESKEIIYEDDDSEASIRWGNLPKADLDFLEFNYNQWVTRHQCETRAEEILYEEITQLQLDIKKLEKLVEIQ